MKYLNKEFIKKKHSLGLVDEITCEGARMCAQLIFLKKH